MARTQLESLGVHPGSKEEKLFVKYVDESSFSAVEWIEALQEFSEWMSENKREYKASSALEYLHCSAFSAENHVIKPMLWKIVAQMLKDFGFDELKQGC